MNTWLALLRGVNVGGHNKVPMAELRVKLAEAGFANVRTYIQSGNVLIDTLESDRARISRQIHDLILAEFSVTSPAVMVTRQELAAALARNPFQGPDADPKAQRVMFLLDEPPPERIARLDADRSPGHRFVIEGRTIWLDIPQFHTTKLTNDYFDRTLGTVSTLRNLATCEALLKLMNADS